jgi:hypothetical protein
VERVLRAIQSEVKPGESVTANELRRRIFNRVQVSQSQLTAIIRAYGRDILDIHHPFENPQLMGNSYQGRDENG